MADHFQLAKTGLAAIGQAVPKVRRCSATSTEGACGTTFRHIPGIVRIHPAGLMAAAAKLTCGVPVGTGCSIALLLNKATAPENRKPGTVRIRTNVGRRSL